MGNICNTSLSGLPMTGNSCSEKLGQVKAVILYDEYKELPRSISSSGSMVDVDFLTTIVSDLNDGKARLLTGMRGRASANTAAVTGTLDDYTEQLAPVVLADTFQFVSSICSFDILKSLIGFNGYAFIICQSASGRLQIAYQEVQNYSVAPLPLKITTIDTTGMFADGANIQTITLTFEWGYITDFNLSADYFDGTINSLPNPVEVIIAPVGEDTYAVINKCTKSNYLLTGSTITLSNVTVNGSTQTATATASTGNLFTVTGITATTGQIVSFSAKIVQNTITVAEGNITYTVS